MTDVRIMYETARALRVHLEGHLANVTAYQDETREKYDQLQSLATKLYARLTRALESEEVLARRVAADQRPAKKEAA
jgi:phage shock protein A